MRALSSKPVYRRCPECGKLAVAADLFHDGDYCFPSQGGCGHHFPNLTITADGLTKGVALEPYKHSGSDYSLLGGLVHKLKYDTSLSDEQKIELVEQAVAEIEKRGVVENLVGGVKNLVVVPAPSSKNRTIQHVYEIARRIADSRYPYLEALVKTTSTESKTMKRGGRYQKGDFRCDCSLDGCSVLIVDDTYGEGATLEACISALLECGAGDIYFMSLCKNTGGGIKQQDEEPDIGFEGEIPF